MSATSKVGPVPQTQSGIQRRVLHVADVFSLRIVRMAKPATEGSGRVLARPRTSTRTSIRGGGGAACAPGLLPHLSHNRVACGRSRILAAVASAWRLARRPGMVHLGAAGIRLRGRWPVSHTAQLGRGVGPYISGGRSSSCEIPRIADRGLGARVYSDGIGIHFLRLGFLWSVFLSDQPHIPLLRLFPDRRWSWRFGN